MEQFNYDIWSAYGQTKMSPTHTIGCVKKRAVIFFESPFGPFRSGGLES